MPFSLSDVDKHNKGLSKKQKNKWLSVANSVYSQCMTDSGSDEKCAEKAIRIANASTKVKSKENSSDIINSNLLFENFHIDATEAKVDKKSNMIKNARIIVPGLSKNKRYYSKEALSTLVPYLAEAKVMFVNHRMEELGRDLGDLISVMENVHQDSKTGKVYADIKLLGNEKYAYLIEAIKDDPTVIGLSIFAFFIGHQDEMNGMEVTIVDKFVAAHSVDWVYSPGAGGGFDEAQMEISMNDMSFTSDEVLTLMESVGGVNINIEEIVKSTAQLAKEDFQSFLMTRATNNIFYYFDEYIRWEILYAQNLSQEEKLQLIDAAFVSLKNYFIDFLSKSEYWEKEMETEENYLEKFSKFAEDSENESLKSFIKSIESTINQKKEELRMSEKDIKGRNPDYDEIRKIGIGEATEAFLTEKTTMLTKIETLTSLEAKNVELATQLAALTEQKDAIEKELTEYKNKELEAQKQLKATEREELIKKTVEEANVEADKIPSVIVEKMKNVDLYSDEDVYQTIRSFAVESKEPEAEPKKEEKKSSLDELEAQFSGKPKKN